LVAVGRAIWKDCRWAEKALETVGLENNHGKAV